MHDRVKVAGATTNAFTACDLVCCGTPLSETFTVNEKLPAVVGVPVIVPVEGFKFRPPGNVPPLIE